MKFTELRLQNFGPFDDRTVSFSSGLTVLFGRNEAGKSSLLRAVRSALFGVTTTKLGDKTVRTLDGWENDGRKASLTATGVLDDGREIEFERTTSTKTPVSGTLDGDALDADGLARVLCVDRTQYEHMFGFTLSELRAGQNSLQDASVAEVLLGGGLGRLSAFRALQKELEKQTSELFSPRGNAKTKVINACLDRVHETQTSLREQTVTPEHFEQDSRQIAADEATALQLASEIERSRTELSQLARWDEADRLFKDWHAAVAEQTAIGIDNPVGEAILPNVNACLTTLDQLRDEQAAAEERLSELATEVKTLSLDPEIATHATTIERLQDERTHVAELRRRIPELQDNLAALSARLESTDGESNEFPDDAAEQVAHWLRLRDQQRDQQREVASQLVAVQRQLSEREQTVAVTSDKQAYEVRVLATADRLASWSARRDRFDDLVRFCSNEQQRLDTLKLRLAQAVGWTSWPPSVDAVPTTAALITQQRESVERQQEVADCQAVVARLSVEQQTCLDELEVLAASPVVVTADQLAAARSERDRAISELATASDVIAAVAQVQQLVRRGDELADRMTANAQEAAREATLRQRLVQIERDLKDAGRRLSGAQSAITDWEAAWRALWQRCDAEPIPPDNAVTWSEEFADVQEQDAALRERIAEREERTAERAELTAAIRQLASHVEQETDWPDEATADVWLRETVQTIRDRQSNRRRAEEQIPTYIAERDALTKEQAGLDQAAAEVNAAFQNWRDSSKLPDDWTLETVAERLETQAQTAELSAQRHDTETQLARAKERVAAFDADAATLPASSPESVVSEIVQTCVLRLQTHREQDIRAQELSKQQALEKQRLQTVIQKREAAEEQFAALREGRNDDSEAAFRFAVSQSAVYWEKAQVVRVALAKLEVVAGDQPVEELEALLQAHDAAARDARRRELVTEIEATENERRVILDHLAVRRRERDALRNADRLSDLQNELESHRADLRDAVERYAPVLLLRQILGRTVERFEASIRPELLSDVAALFSKLTDGDYVDVDRRLDGETLHVVSQDGRRKSPAELSTGTRELLYLAVRLAFIRQRVQSRESLPVLLDDVLVNLDAGRMRAVIETLGELSKDTQVILLSCRPDVVAIFQQLELTESITDLEDGDAATALALLAPSKRPRRPAERSEPRPPETLLFDEIPEPVSEIATTGENLN